MDPEDAGSCAAPPEPYNGSNGPTAGRLGGWFKSTAASLEVHVKEIRANSKLIAADLQNAHQEAKSKIQKSFAGGVLAPGLEEVQLKVTFEEGSLGLNLDLADGQVIKVTPGGQAEQLGLRVQDRLLAVRGCSLPAVSEPNFQEAAKKQLSLAKQRPVNMTFLRIVPSEGKKNKEAQEESQQLRQAQAKIDELQVQVAARTNEAKAAREEAKALQAELQLAQNWTAQEERELQALRSELDDLRLRTKTNQAEAKRDEVKVAIQDEQALRDRAGAAAAEGDEEEEKRLQSALQKLQTSNKELELARLAREDLAGQLMRATADCMQHMQHEESSQKASARASLLEEELQREKTKLEQLRRQMSEASESLAKAEAEREELQASSNLLVDEMQSLRRILQQHESSESAARRLLEEQLAETKSSATKLREELQRAEAELEEKELWRRRLLELEEEARLQPGGELEVERKRAAQLESNLLLLREQLHHLEAERGILQEELCKAAADLRQADAESTGPPGPVPAATIGKEVAEAEADETRRPWQLQARLGELEAENAALKRSLNQRPIVYQFAPPDAGIDSPDEQGEGDTLPEAEVVSTSQSFSAHGQHFAQSLARRCLWFWQHCRKRRWMWGLEQQLRWLTRRILERPFLMWAFYLHVLVLWCLEVWHQALAKPLPADPAMALEAAVQAARSG